MATQSQGGEIDVARVCELANLALAPGELEMFQGQMATIVAYVRKIGELDVSGIEPTVHGQPVHNVFREDVRKVWLDRERVLANAPERVGNEFRVPRIVE
jgi:aspartyl-tRNA(Asn)/glutamyl-tRNA(Gln) amidotransferase subunit C